MKSQNTLNYFVIDYKDSFYYASSRLKLSIFIITNYVQLIENHFENIDREDSLEYLNTYIDNVFKIHILSKIQPFFIKSQNLKNIKHKR